MIQKHKIQNDKEGLEVILKDNTSVAILSNHSYLKEKVEESLSRFISSKVNNPIRRSVNSALFPGRRLRPVLLYQLLNSANTQEDTNLDSLALAVELCHRSSIIIDDLIDGDNIRRQELAHHKVYGEGQSIILSHYLISAVYQQLSLLPDPIKDRSIPIFTEAYRKMSIAELADINAIAPEKNYMDLFEKRILYKTSALFELVFHLAGILRGFDDSQIQLMTQVGEKTGQLYQIYNDIYDDLMSSNGERGVKDTWKINLSLGTCFILDNGSDEEKCNFLSLVGKECIAEKYYKAREVLRSPRYIEHIIDYGEASYTKLVKMIPQIRYDDIRQTVLNFSEWLRQKKCWDQKEFTKAGY